MCCLYEISENHWNDVEQTIKYIQVPQICYIKIVILYKNY